MGVVFLADDPQLERQVALKVMLPQVAANPTAKERFLREARAAAKAQERPHRHHSPGRRGRGVPYLAMELLEGQSLDDLLRGRPAARAPPRSCASAGKSPRAWPPPTRRAWSTATSSRATCWLEGEPGASRTGAARQDPRLRPGPRREGGRPPHAVRRHRRHARLHGPGAGPRRQARRRPRRPLLAGLRPLPPVRRRHPVQGRDDDGHAAGHRHRTSRSPPASSTKRSRRTFRS